VPDMGRMWIIIEYVEVRRKEMENDMNMRNCKKLDAVCKI
jgi:hypothetical protein